MLTQTDESVDGSQLQDRMCRDLSCYVCRYVVVTWRFSQLCDGRKKARARRAGWELGESLSYWQFVVKVGFTIPGPALEVVEHLRLPPGFGLDTP